MKIILSILVVVSMALAAIFLYAQFFMKEGELIVPSGGVTVPEQGETLIAETSVTDEGITEASLFDEFEKEDIRTTIGWAEGEGADSLHTSVAWSGDAGTGGYLFSRAGEKITRTRVEWVETAGVGSIRTSVEWMEQEGSGSLFR